MRSVNYVMAFCAIFFTFVLLCFEGQVQAKSPDLLPLRVGVYPTTYTRLIGIAAAKGYFEACGVNADVKEYPSGTSALEAVIRGEIDIGTVVDFRFAWRMLEEPDLRAVASTGEVFESRIIARKDRGITSPLDLKGKRVGFVPNTISEFALHTFLFEKNMSLSDIHAVPIELLEQAQAVVSGEVDAVSAFVTFAFDALDGLGENGVAWDSRFHTTYNALLVVNKRLIKIPHAVPRFLKALIMAESYSFSNVEEVKAIIMRDWKFDRETIDQYWEKTRVAVTLNQSVIISLNLYSRWLMEKNNISGPQPDVFDFLDSGPLDQIAPERVTFFR